MPSSHPIPTDDVILQRPEDLRLFLSVPHSMSACAGAVTAYVLRRIAHRAGAYAPGIQEHLFYEATTTAAGRSIDALQGWFRDRQSLFQEIGYRFSARRVAERTPGILAWVKEGGGYRGALLPTEYKRLHPTVSGIDAELPHAVGVTVERLDGANTDELVMSDPWPGVGNPDRTPIPPALEPAHRDRNYHAIIFYWTGWA
jgi:hypothetical protein